MGETNASDVAPIMAASAWRRLAAYLIDYVVFMLPLLGLLTLGSWALFDFQPPISSNPWIKHGAMILFLTLPIALYFAGCEASRLQGTIGKRLMRVKVVDTDGRRASFRQTGLRVIVKLLPWELFHAIIWHWDGWPTNPAPITTVQVIAIACGWLAMGWYVASLFVGLGRTPYDRVAGTAVTMRTG